MKHLRVISALLIGWMAGTAPAVAGDLPISTFGGRVNVPVTSLKERAFSTVQQQQFDFSCGSAALASLLTHHYNAPATEAQVFEAMYKAGDKEQIHQNGFSLLDMKMFLNSLGIAADGYKISLDQLAEAGVPAITLIDLNGYKHFVIIKGVRDGEVLIGDPARGLQVVPRAEFERMWNGILFVIRNDLELARSTFNRPEDWAVRPDAPLAFARDRQGLASFGLSVRSVNEF